MNLAPQLDIPLEERRGYGMQITANRVYEEVANKSSSVTWWESSLQMMRM